MTTDQSNKLDAIYNKINKGNDYIAYGNEKSIKANEPRIVELDFTPNFAIMVSQPVYDQYNRLCGYLGVATDNLPNIYYSPLISCFTINKDTYSINTNVSNYLEIAENQIIIKIDRARENVFWLACRHSIILT